MSSRPDLELALDVRSYENVIVLADPDGDQEYPERWSRPELGGLGMIGSDSVVIIDRIDVQRRTLSSIGERRPRLLAMAPQDVDQEKSMRRLISGAFPWAQVWTVYTDFGKLLVTAEALGRAYDRDELVETAA